MLKMPREKKDAVVLNIKLARKVSEMLNDYCEDTGQTKTTAIERILANEIHEYFTQPKGERIPK